MNTNKGSIVQQSGNDVEGCQSEKILVHPNMHVFLQYGVNYGHLTEHFAQTVGRGRVSVIKLSSEITSGSSTIC